MKGRESGMPEEAIWEQFFNINIALDYLLGKTVVGNVTEFGCGYGTFTLPTASRTTGTVTALDIEPEMIAHVVNKAKLKDITNIDAQLCDFVSGEAEIATASQAHTMIFNLLHIEEPVMLLKEAFRILQVGGTLSVIHWRSDIPTPRGPSLSIRPSIQQCSEWMQTAGFAEIEIVDLQDCCPYHFGLIAKR